MDLSEVKPQSRSIQIKHPATQELTGLTITLLPSSDERIKAAKRKHLNARLHSRRQKVTAEQIEQASIDIICVAVDGWVWGKDAGGEQAAFEGGQPEFSDINLRKVLKKLDWVREQIDEELGDDAAFFQN